MISWKLYDHVLLLVLFQMLIATKKGGGVQKQKAAKCGLEIQKSFADAP